MEFEHLHLFEHLLLEAVALWLLVIRGDVLTALPPRESEGRDWRGGTRVYVGCPAGKKQDIRK